MNNTHFFVILGWLWPVVEAPNMNGFQFRNRHLKGLEKTFNFHFYKFNLLQKCPSYTISKFRKIKKNAFLPKLKGCANPIEKKISLFIHEGLLVWSINSNFWPITLRSCNFYLTIHGAENYTILYFQRDHSPAFVVMSSLFKSLKIFCNIFSS